MSIEQTVANFSSELRKIGRRVGIEESLDATRALKLIGISDPDLFQASIKATLIKDFDTSQTSDTIKSRSETIVRFGAQNQKVGKGIPYPDMSKKEDQFTSKDKNFQFGMYSPLGIESTQTSPKISRLDEKRWATGITRFKTEILTLEGHRFKRSNAGQINVRKTLQLELKKAAESPSVFRTLKKVSKANVVLLCDVSGSMSDSSSSIVNLCCSLKRAIPKSEIFLFSTRLVRITYYTSKYEPKELALRIPKLDLGFGGGTKIGQCLRQFRHLYGGFLTRKTTVMIFSDGWDIGDLSTLKHEMRELQKTTSRIVWINPFLDSKDYTVETQGMRTALEYVDSFISPSILTHGKTRQMS